MRNLHKPPFEMSLDSVFCLIILRPSDSSQVGPGLSGLSTLFSRESVKVKLFERDGFDVRAFSVPVCLV